MNLLEQNQIRTLPGLRQTEQERNAVGIVGAKRGEFPADFPRADAPCGKHGLLFEKEVLVENQPAASSRVRELRGAGGVSDAARVPEHRARKRHGFRHRFRGDGVRPRGAQFIHRLPALQSGEDLPHHTREPLKVGLPWQVPLSATMYLPNSTRVRAGEAGCPLKPLHSAAHR